MTAVDKAHGAGNDMDDLVVAARTLLSTLPHQPERLCLRSGDASVEVAWATGAGTPGAAVPAAPAERHADPARRFDAGQPEPHRICAPSVGTFYRAPEPGAEPFVTEGDQVTTGQQVGIVEAMKLMLPVEADRAGRVAHVCRSDGDSVEYGEPLVELVPDEEA
ncbi:MAG TPA: acetyl-CoA carboxylase biotin carboxyl carrier protein subunit [Pseudonocardiaceae bacterium]|nr:acetyl-CoA carboxylase biotin carboxyl carrier protein subunit [Pseudonocardiaceae bacterium]